MFNKKKFYATSRWKNLRKRMLQDYPLCIRCKNLGILKASTVVDHLQGFKNFQEAVLEESLFTLCHKCHAYVTNRELSIDYRKMTRKEALAIKYSNSIKKEWDF